MYKAIVFDFGNVLCSLDRESFITKAAAHSRLGEKELFSALWNNGLEQEYETGKFDSHGYYERIKSLASFDAAYDYDAFVADFIQIIQPNPDGEAALVKARDLGYRTFVLSNTAFLHANLIFSNELMATIPELHILSYKVGVMKPNPGIWLKLLEYSGLKAEECFYIDDVQKYCDAARSLGFGAFQYDKNVHNLSQVIENRL